MSLELKALIAAMAAGLGAVGSALGLAAMVRSSPPPPLPTPAASAPAGDTGTPPAAPAVTPATVPPAAPAPSADQPAPSADQPVPGTASPAPAAPPAVTTPTPGQAGSVGQAPAVASNNPPNRLRRTPRFTPPQPAPPQGVSVTPVRPIQPAGVQPGAVTGRPTTPPQVQPALITPAATVAPAAQIAMGKALFTPTCASCHGADGQGGLGPSLHHLASSDLQIMTIIKNGKGVMPAYGTKYTDPQIQALLFYSRSLR